MTDAYTDYVNAILSFNQEKSEVSRLKMQIAIKQCLEECADQQIPLPEEISEHLRHGFENLLNGFIPPVFQPKKRGQGERQDSLLVQKCKECAVIYILYCKGGFISDKSYNKTIAEAYKVKSTTVRGWVGNIANKISVNENISEEKIAEIVRNMRFAAKHYPFLDTAASHEAIRNRATKK